MSLLLKRGFKYFRSISLCNQFLECTPHYRVLQSPVLPTQRIPAGCPRARIIRQALEEMKEA
ncbi:unnamed protein product [Dovyalis caffra]|uniref:Uncharacterized protein n=1 Tax=Dovyalis caffra TaxID=77055 RepID=A0AAV1S694_9ROSI|nr:unnamed protein product [Dovyalis caffra]